MGGYDLVQLNGVGSEGQSLSKSAKKRRNRRAREAAEKEAAGKLKGKGQAKVESRGGSERVISLGNGAERRDAKKSEESFTPVRRRRDNAGNKQQQQQQQAEAATAQKPASDPTPPSSSKPQAPGREAVRMVGVLLDGKEGSGVKDQLASSISVTQSSEEYGKRAAEVLVSVSQEVKALRGHPGLESKSKQFLVEVVGALTTSEGGDGASRSEDHRNNVRQKFERLGKLKQAESGPKLLERARVTLDWNRMVAGELDKSLGGGIREDPKGKLDPIVKRFRDSCARDQANVLRGSDPKACELPPEVAKVDEEIASLEKRLAELKTRRAALLDKHRSAQSAEKRHLLSFFDKAMEAARSLDAEFAGLKGLLGGPGKRTKATKEQEELFSRYAGTVLSLAACKTIQQSELSAKFDFYTEQIAEFANDKTGDNASFVAKLTNMATNALADAGDICETVLGATRKLEKYASKLQMKEVSLSPGAVQSFYDDVAKMQGFHEGTVEKARSLEGMGFSSATAVDVQKAAAIVKGVLKGVKLTGKDPVVAAPAKKDAVKEETKPGAEGGKGESKEKGSKEKKLTPAEVPKENAWGKSEGLALFK